MASDQPHPTEVDPLVRAYEIGDFAAVRVLAAQIAGDPAVDPERAALARSYRARVGVDREVWGALGFALLLFCAILVRYVF